MKTPFLCPLHGDKEDAIIRQDEEVVEVALGHFPSALDGEVFVHDPESVMHVHGRCWIELLDKAGVQRARQED
jgi:hypothetical protein